MGFSGYIPTSESSKWRIFHGRHMGKIPGQMEDYINGMTHTWGPWGFSSTIVFQREMIPELFVMGLILWIIVIIYIHIQYYNIHIYIYNIIIYIYSGGFLELGILKSPCLFQYEVMVYWPPHFSTKGLRLSSKFIPVLRFDGEIWSVRRNSFLLSNCLTLFLKNQYGGSTCHSTIRIVLFELVI